MSLGKVKVRYLSMAMLFCLLLSSTIYAVDNDEMIELKGDDISLNDFLQSHGEMDLLARNQGLYKPWLWGNDVTIATGTVVGGIATTYDNDGNLYAARCTTDNNGIERGRIVVYKSTNGGQEWEFFGAVSSMGDDQFSYPELLVCQKADSNFLYIFFLDHLGTTSALFVSRYALDGTYFSVLFMVGESEASQSITYYSACSNLDGDTLIVVYEVEPIFKSGPPPSTPVLHSIMSTNFGGSWIDDKIVDSDGAHPDVAYGAGGYVYVVYQKTLGSDYEIEFQRSTDYGNTWGEWEELTLDSYDDDYPKVAALHTNAADNATVWVVYNHSEPAYKSGSIDLRFAYSTNSGVDWTKDQLLAGSSLIDENQFAKHVDCKSQPCDTTLDTLWGGTTLYYYWQNPHPIGFMYFNERFDMPGDHGGRLERIQISFWENGSIGTPNADLYVWESDGLYPLDPSPPAGAIADFHVNYGDFTWYPSYTVVETWDRGIEFMPGESFHIGFGCDATGGDTLAGLSDDGSLISNRSTSWGGDHWGTMLDDWVVGVDFLINAVICPYPPTLPCETTPDTLWGATFAYYGWRQPPNDEFINMRFEMPADYGGRLDEIQISFYQAGSDGTPDPDLYVWSSDGVYPLDGSPPAGAIAEFHIDYNDITWFPSYTVVETWQQGIEFAPGEKFHIGYSHAHDPDDTLCGLSDDGSMGTDRSSGWTGSVWESYSPYEFLINAVICPEIVPLYDEMAADLKVYRSPTNTYVDLGYLRRAIIRDGMLDICYTYSNSSMPDSFRAPHSIINDHLSYFSPDGREVCQLTFPAYDYPGIVYAGSPPFKNGAWNLYFDYYYFTDVEEESAEEELPTRFSLSANYPNPFNPVTRIQYTVGSKNAKPVTLRIYNVLGQLVRTLVNEPQEAGTYEVIWDGKDENGNEIASGVYFYKLEAEDFSQTKKMVLLK